MNEKQAKEFNAWQLAEVLAGNLMPNALEGYQAALASESVMGLEKALQEIEQACGRAMDEGDNSEGNRRGYVISKQALAAFKGEPEKHDPRIDTIEMQTTSPLGYDADAGFCRKESANDTDR